MKIIKPINFLHSKFSRETIQIVGLHACSILKNAQPIHHAHTRAHTCTHTHAHCSRCFKCFCCRAQVLHKREQVEAHRTGADQASIVNLANSIRNDNRLGYFRTLWQAAISRETIWPHVCIGQAVRLCDICDFATRRVSRSSASA